MNGKLKKIYGQYHSAMIISEAKKNKTIGAYAKDDKIIKATWRKKLNSKKNILK